MNIADRAISRCQVDIFIGWRL